MDEDREWPWAEFPEDFSTWNACLDELDELRELLGGTVQILESLDRGVNFLTESDHQVIEEVVRRARVALDDKAPIR